MNDNVNHPAHYTQGNLELIDAIEGLNLGFHMGNVLKYGVRYQLKHDSLEEQLEDLEKMVWYASRLLEKERQRLSEKPSNQ